MPRPERSMDARGDWISALRSAEFWASTSSYGTYIIIRRATDSATSRRTSSSMQNALRAIPPTYRTNYSHGWRIILTSGSSWS